MSTELRIYRGDQRSMNRNNLNSSSNSSNSMLTNHKLKMAVEK